MKDKIVKYYNEINSRINNVHISCFKDMDKPLFLISDTYPGVWLEHVYDSIFYAKLTNKRIDVAKNTVNLFINNQKEDGQLPFYILDGNKVNMPQDKLLGFSQIQECVAFYKLCLMLYKICKDDELLIKCYESGKKWIDWLYNNRMTSNRGLVEMFCGYDTGHDNSGRLNGISNKGLYKKDGIIQNASVIPDNDDTVPILAVDMNCNLYSNLISLAEIAQIIGKDSEKEILLKKAETIKELLFKYCFDKNDCFFYDVDKNGNKRKFLSSTIFHLFLEEVLDPKKDKKLIESIYNRHIKNPNEFWTNYPFPSMAVNDPSAKEHAKSNCWGYYSQGLIALRATLWMDKYNMNKDFDVLCQKWVEAWTKHYDILKFGQELDPFTGIPSDCSQWYSSTMLFYLYAVERLKYIDKKSPL